MQPIVPKENDVVSGCLRYLNGQGIFAWRNNNAGIARVRAGRMFHTFNGIKGVADIVGCLHDGRILCVEAKRPGKLNDQSEFQKDNGIYILCDSWSMLETKLKELGVIKE